MMMMVIQVRWREGSLSLTALSRKALPRCQLASSGCSSVFDIHEWTRVNFDLTRIAYFSLFVIFSLLFLAAAPSPSLSAGALAAPLALAG